MNKQQYFLSRFVTAVIILSMMLNPIISSAQEALAAPANAPQQDVPDCQNPPNEIVAENCLAGNPASEWDISGAGDENIQGYATDISVDQGGTIEFKVDTDATDYRLDIYRLGYYNGDGARFIATVEPSASLPQTQPACTFVDTDDINLLDCGNWAVSASWTAPTDATSGVYTAKLVREDGTAGASHITFILRDDDGNSDLLFQTSDTTWQAYNQYGGYSLYGGPGPLDGGHAHKVSYNRPFTTRDTPTEDWLFNAEYPMIRWLERNGYDVSYFTDVDADRYGSEILEHQIFLSVGHDEYWSAGQRAAVEAARDAGVHLAFFSGNEVYWKTRWEASTADGGSTAYRTLVSYKEGDAQGSEHYNCLGNFDCDPDPTVWTGLWRQNQTDHDGGQPENSLSGNISWKGTTTTIQVPTEYQDMRFWRNTPFAASGTSATLAANTLGYEWDFEQYHDYYPDGRFWLSSTDSDGVTHHLSLYRASSSALVFGAGTVQWSWGLDGTHDRGTSSEDVNMQQATVNLFADMGVQPSSLQSGLVAATASTDTTGPTAAISSPVSGTNVASGSTVTVTGTATDTGGGVVAAVEVSLDNGLTWMTASGRDTWSFNFVAGAEGTSLNMLSRAVDDSGNIGAASAGVTLNVTARVCPCSIWNDTITPGAAGNDGQPIEVGVKFQASEAGTITGLRFYKDPANTGTHTGHLWDANGTQLAEVVFTGETASGWQEVYFAAPVEILADTSYVASYHSSGGGYAYNQGYFATAYDSPPLRALADGEDGANGVYKYGPSGFPTETYQSSNYWVDVIYDNTPLTYSLWEQGAISGDPDVVDPSAVELGMKFKSDVSGKVTGVAFYKGATNTGPFLGHLWTLGGTQLTEKSYTNNTSEEGWQIVTFDTPVDISADTTYVVSYYTQSGNYAAAGNYFTSEVYNPPLRGLATGDPDGPNGVFLYATGGGFPTGTFNAGNYWVDVVFAPDVYIDTAPPVVVSTIPLSGQVDVSITGNFQAVFSEGMDETTINGGNFELRDASNNLVPAVVSYDAGATTATLDPTSFLAHSTTYTATVIGGADGVADLAGNEMAANYSWTFTTSDPPPLPPDDGPDGPILIISNASNPFTRYYTEILRAEGLNEFLAVDISSVDATLLADYQVAILGEMPLSATQVTLLTDWVTNGGNLIAMRPDAQLAGLLGLTSVGGSLAEGYLLVDTASAPGSGIVGETIQYHDSADLYSLSGATAIATLYSDTTTATSNPAVTLVSVGSNGGQAAAFTFDLAKSIVYTRQGNPAWVDINGDGSGGPVRADDLFHNGTDPDWVDLNKVAIPQTDEQQRLLANLVTEMNLDNMPLPRFWYLPRGEKAVVLLTSDDHGSGVVPGRLDRYMTLSPDGCSVDDWECVRSSMYIYPGTTMTATQANDYTAAGFEIGVHVDTGCANYDLTGLENYYNTQIGDFTTRFPSLPLQDSERTHCIAWSGWAYQPNIKEQQGIRLDTNYYFWPPDWVNNQPGLFTGSGMPMRFADLDGSIFDIYQATTQMTDESGQTYPYTIDTLIDRALGPEGYYGVFTANMHTNGITHAGAEAIIASAQANSVPIVSGRQLLTWLDGRNGSAFEVLTWDTDTLTFNVSIASGANGLQVMLPVQSSVGPLSGITLDDSPVTYTQETIKGVEYAIFDAQAGAYAARYATDTSAPVITNVNAVPVADGTALITWDTNELADSLVEYGTTTGVLNQNKSDGAAVTSHSITLTGLAPNTTYYFQVTSEDASANSATSVEFDFITHEAVLADTSVSDFTASLSNTCYIAETDGGELILAPTEGAEFEGTAIPTGWESDLWNPAGSISVDNGELTLDWAYVRTVSFYPAGRSLEFVATFSDTTTSQSEHIGFGTDLNSPPWAIFSTKAGGNTLWARTNNTEIDLGNYLGQPHHFRIVWLTNQVLYYIDGSLVATHNVTISGNMRPIASDGSDSSTFSIDWMRMSPYTSLCTFESRIFDAGAVVTWETMAWTAEVPTDTSLSLSYRIGDTPTPDGSWTAFIPVSSSPVALSGSSQYIQYQAELATSDDTITPVLEDVIFSYSTGGDTIPPTIVSRTPAPGALEIDPGTNVVVSFSEQMDAATITNATFTLRADGSASDVPAVVIVLGTQATLNPVDPLLPGTLYHVTVSGSVTDLAGNPLGSDDAWSFTTAFVSMIDTTSADFSAGSGACVVDPTIGDGALRLPLTVDEQFEGTELPTGWAAAVWDQGPGYWNITGGALIVNQSRAYVDSDFSPGHILEFVATFQPEIYQHIGFVSDAAFNPPWIIFSTGNTTTTLYARTNPGNDNVAIPGDWIGSPHLYRIEWYTDRVDFYIDNELRHTETVSINGPMRPIVSDINSDTYELAVDWMTMTPYVDSCTFESQVMDASVLVDWLNLDWMGDLPAGTTVEFETRSGNALVPDGDWSEWTAVSSDLVPSPDSRYVQYRATLSSTDSATTPIVEKVQIFYQAVSNTAPVAYDDAFSTDEDTDLTTPAPGVLANDIDGEGDPLSAILDTGPSNGTLTLNTDGSFTYTPAADFNATDSFTYHANDGALDSNVATVTITINPVNDPPVVTTNEVLTVDEGGTELIGTVNLEVTDVEQPADQLVYTVTVLPTHGTLTPVSFTQAEIDANAVSYTHDGSESFTDSFTFTVSDGVGGTTSPTVFNITINPVNDPPVAVDDSAATDEDTAVTIDVLANDSDVEGDALTVDSVTQGSNGTVTNNGTDVVYTPDADYCGDDSFTYTVSDGNGGSDTAMVSVTVTCVNDAPVANDDSAATDEDTAVTIDVLANDSDVEGDGLTAVLDTGPSNGSLTLNADGSFTYTPDVNFNGTDSFTYHANDGALDSNVATVQITINPVNDAPVALDDSASTDEDSPVTINVLANDSDIEGDPLTPILLSGPSYGLLGLNSDGSYTYTPGTTHSPTDSFTYKVTDGELESNTATVTITINDLKPAILVAKTTAYPYVNQGDNLTFTIEVTNQSASTDPITITSIDDDVYGEILGATDTDCAEETIDPGETYTCTFAVTAPANLIGDQTDMVTVKAVDDEGNQTSDTDDETVTILPKSKVTNSSLCIFDRNPETSDREFRLLFTPDVKNYPAFKLTASNPGQFFYNVFYTGGGETASVEVTIPYPFVTQGATPVHVYSSISTYTNDKGETCFTPEGSETSLQELITLESYGSSATFGGTVTLVFTDLPVDPVTGLVYLNMHLDYGLKGPGVDANQDGKVDRYEKQGRLVDGTTLYDAANYDNLTEILIEDRYAYTFTSSNDLDGDTIFNQNVFKVTPGIAGFVFELIGGELEIYTHKDLTVRLVIPKNVKDHRDYLEVFPDEDGWYMIEYKHTGKPTNYRFEVYRGDVLLVEKTVRLKGNEYEEVHIYLDGDSSGGDPPPQPPPPPSTTHYVSELQDSSKVTKKSWNAKVLVTVLAQDGNPVANAKVSGIWIMDGVEKPAFCETDETGTCEVALNKIDADIGSVELNITDVFVEGSIYDSDESVTYVIVWQ